MKSGYKEVKKATISKASASISKKFQQRGGEQAKSKKRKKA
jgi:hypothetical protein